MDAPRCHRAIDVVKRSPMPQRSKPLQSKTRLNRGTAQLKRVKPIRHKASPNDFSDDVKAAVERRSGGLCEANTPVCRNVARHHHHIKPRRARDNSESNDLHVCSPCHIFIHAYPSISYAEGWLIKVNTAG